ncbi:c-type cytochrome [Melaminivora sp.]|uniref:c-type cytochrome n=1 Tax=Melaminivora sp. TaxID=1933032 RepID=UPI0028AE6240|nr:c-type cytochrome [Melaminivora sp.]
MKIPRIRGLLLFAGVLVALVLGVVIASNVVFKRQVQDKPWPATPTAAQVASEPPAPPAPAAPAADARQQPALAPDGVASATARLVERAGFAPPAEIDLPDDEFGKMVRLGERIFMETGKHAPQYVGNRLNCVNCHIDAGRQADSAPMWAAFVHYPAYRKKTGEVDTLASRLQGCFMYSMNGKAPPADSEVLTALQSYAFWLAKGAPVGTPMPGSGYPKLDKPAQAPDYARGEQVYAQNCALCHGADGQGQRVGDTQVFPPLWGPQSFNWGAGMHGLANASGFIHANMPLGRGRTLTGQQAWDVALFMNSHERPQDPRFTGSVAETRKKYHDTDDSMYGRTVNGYVLGSGRP